MRRGRMLTMAAGVVALAGVLASCTGGTESAEACDRECLIGLTEAYLAAMVAGDPGRAPVAGTVTVTENTRPIELGQGAWETLAGVRDYKVYVTDPTEGQVALYHLHVPPRRQPRVVHDALG